jgi:hypothetical protein
MVLLAAAAVAFEISAPAHAAVDSATPAASSLCLEWVLVDKGDGYRASISSSGALEFVAADLQRGFCFAGIANTNFSTIYTYNGSNYLDCLAWSAAAKDAYQHNPTGCGGNTNYLEWLAVPEGSDSNGEYYLYQNQYSGMCFYSYGGSSTPVYGTCNAASQADEFYLKAPPA